jgi:hypothetical protein
MLAYTEALIAAASKRDKIAVACIMNVNVDEVVLTF